MSLCEDGITVKDNIWDCGYFNGYLQHFYGRLFLFQFMFQKFVYVYFLLLLLLQLLTLGVKKLDGKSNQEYKVINSIS